MSIEIITAALANFPDIEQAWIFGSVANGRATRDSDVDVAVQKAAPLSG